MRTKLRRLNRKSCLWLGLLLSLLLVVGIRQIVPNWGEPPYHGARWRQDQEAQVMEAVFRYQIREHRNNGQICFLAVKNAPPERAVMNRLSDLPFALPLSPRFGTGPNGYTDKTTGKAALHFWIDRIGWDSDADVRLEGGGAAAGMSGDAGVFTASWRRGGWTVSYERRVMF